MVFSSSGEERRLVMSTKMGFWRWALACAAVLIATGPAGAFVIDPTGVSTDEPTALVLYPRLKVDTNTCEAGFCSLTPSVACVSNSDCNGCNTTTGKCRLSASITCTSDSQCPGAGVDTIVQLTNTSEFLTKVHCFYTNANSHCSNAPTTICTDENFRSVCPTGGLCVPGWVENDFHLTLTKRQPISWSVNQGLPSLPLAHMPGMGTPPQNNDGSIPAVSEVPFTGELLCIEVDVATELPSDRNDFKGEATTVKTILSQIDANKYNGIGIKAIEGAQDDNPSVLNIGGPNAEYGVFDDQVNPPQFAGCPNVLTVDHFFDGANVVTHANELEGKVHSELTIVPCQRDYLHQTANGNITTIQFLIFNEFEQRFSTSTKLNCYKQVRLSDIDTQPGVSQDAFSIFSVGVQGTLTGMSRLRSVAGPDPNGTGYDGRTILAVLSEDWDSGVCSGSGATSGGPPPTSLQLCSSDADCPSPQTCERPGTSTTTANVQFEGSRQEGDQITIPLP
jgi:hypothetical protein